MIIYNTSNNEDAKMELKFDGPTEASKEIAAMLANVVDATCRIYLDNKHKEEVLKTVTDYAAALLKEVND